MGKQNQTGQDRKNTLPTIRDQFTFYRSFYEGINVLQREIRLDVYEAIMEYALNEKIPENLDGAQKTAFILIKPVLDSGRKKAIAGKLGGSKKKAKRKQTESKGEIEKENEVEIENEIEIEDECLWGGFEDFWDLYPVKLGKDNAQKIWDQLRPNPKTVCDGVRKWLQTKQWTEDNGRFIPRAAKFLEERHYAHLPGDHIPKGASGVLGQAELEAIAAIMQN